LLSKHRLTATGNNELDTLTRFPSDLRRYRKWHASIKDQYGSMTNFVVQNRLQWTPLPSSDPAAGPTFAMDNPTPFASPKDYRILPNDWPYGVSPGIKHLVVWLKTRLPVDDDQKGDLTKEGREMIDDFVHERFIKKFGADRVLWFKNWTQIQSVRGVEHVHIFVRDVRDEDLQKLVN
jgi:hypothetical protein